MNGKICLLLRVCFSLLIVGPAAQAQPAYQFVDLGRGEAYSINNSGVVVGATIFPGVYVGTAYSWREGSFTQYSYGVNGSVALSINESGVLAGTSSGSSGSNYAAMWTNGIASQIPFPGLGTWATAVNDQGLVIGSNNSSSFVWDGTAVTSLPALDSSYNVNVRAQAINGSGVVVGYCNAASAVQSKAVIWTGGTVQELPTLGGYRSTANGINEAGVVVGWSEEAGEWQPYRQPKATRWDNMVPSFLGSLDGGPSIANAINEGGTAVGYAYLPGSDKRAVIFQNQNAYDLNSLTNGLLPNLVLREATAVNDSGWIVGISALTTDNNTRAFLLIPVPEPAGALLLIVAGGGLFRRRRPA